MSLFTSIPSCNLQSNNVYYVRHFLMFISFLDYIFFILISFLATYVLNLCCNYPTTLEVNLRYASSNRSLYNWIFMHFIFIVVITCAANMQNLLSFYCQPFKANEMVISIFRFK